MTTRRSLFTSSVALLMCLVMLVGTTFAWFTDIATSSGNVIQSGTLDIDLMKGTPLDNGGWQWASTDGQAIFDYEKWEPGYTTSAVLAVQNKGTLSAKWTAKIRLDGTPTILADVIDVYVTTTYDRDGARPNFNDGTWQNLGTVADVLTNDGLILEGGILQSGQSHPVLIALHMRENAGNDYQDMDLGANFDIVIMATQAPDESDSYDNTYDDNAAADFFPGFQGGSAGAAVTTNDQSETTAQVSMNGGDVSAIIPAGVKLADGANSLKLAVTLKNASEANVQLSNSEKMNSLDVHIEGVAEGNTTPMLVTLKSYLTTGINTGALRMYHVENGATVAMTQVATPTNHNEFSYDPATGDVTLALASFSEVAVIADTNNPWDGKTFDYSWYLNAVAPVDLESATVYTISNADQLAGFGAIVDGTAQDIAQDNFAGKTVKLANNIYLSNQLFDPIGWGYVNTGWNRDGADGKVFQGTFDGNGKTIFDLYQNGWDLEEKTGTDYTYTNCGFGLFAAASNATFKDLTINGAYVRVECVEAGVLVGLSQNNCTYQNIGIHNAKIANYQRPAGGLIGEVSGDGTTTITGVTIGSDVVVGSLWGDFDAPCGGVIGAYWNDVDANPQIVMNNVEVGCTLDVYNDITSAYQWHAYRRAGMLIGNTDMSDPNNAHKAYAPFLTCSNVTVYYGDWVNYTYCSFSNHNSRYPWVRTQAGENCTAFSNPRWGVPNDANGNLVTDMNHVHAEGDECNVPRQFGQLYGGGQGVYGQDKHEGVNIVNYKYSITYVNDYQVLDIIYVTDNTNAFTIKGNDDQAQKLVGEWADANIGVGKYAFGGWMNAGSTKIETIPANNTTNITLYPYFNKPYTARFVDLQGNVVAWCLFHAEDLTKLDAAKDAAEAALPDLGEDLKFDYWEVHITDNNGKVTSKDTYNKNSFAGYTKDVTIYPVYKFEGDVKLIPVDTDSDGIINYYQVAGYSNPNGQALVKIPGSVNGIPVTEISGGAFSSYDGVHSIYVPEEVTYIGNNAFAEKWGTIDSGESITIYYGGSYADWIAKESNFGSDWESGISSSTRIFFLNGGDTVDVSQGYLQAEVKSNWGTRTVTWNHNTTISSSIKEEYTGHCNCEISTTGDTAHIYVDSNGNVMMHNADGTPVNSNGVIIEYKRKNIFSSYKLTTDYNDTYYRYRPDMAYWEGVTAQ